MSNYQEQPFQYLSRKKGGQFDPSVVENWYKAREYVLDKLKDVAFGVNSDEHLQAVVLGDSPLMLSVARQVALSAHFLNYDEENIDESRRKRTVITIESQDADILQKLQQEEYLCNLPNYCKRDIYGQVENSDSYIDIELQVVKEWTGCDSNCCVEMREEEVELFCKTHAFGKIDTRKAVFVSRIYDLGTLVTNLPYEDIHNLKRYAQAVDAFQYRHLKDPWQPLMEETGQLNLYKVKENLSNIFCSDCFETRAKEIEKTKEEDLGKCKDKSKQKKISKENYWEKYISILSQSEHARWVVEKLIMGYRPLNVSERIAVERVIGSSKLKQYRDKLKHSAEDPAHIDICSYFDLRRISPDNMKYDSFLMLAIPYILEKAKEDENK